MRYHPTLAWRQELQAGLTTWLAMAYTLIATPVLLQAAGLPFDTSYVTTCLMTGVGSCVLGWVTRTPIVVGSSMALNAFFLSVMIQRWGLSLDQAFAASLLTGLSTLMVNALGGPRWLQATIPEDFQHATLMGIGGLLGIVALKLSHLGPFKPLTSLAHAEPYTWLQVGVGLLAATWARHRGWSAALLLGAVAAVLVHVALLPNTMGVTTHPAHHPLWLPWRLHLPPATTLTNLHVWQAAFSMTFITVFDTTATCFCLLHYLEPSAPSVPVTTHRTLVCTGLLTSLAAMLRLPPLNPYFESLSGIRSGGRTGLVAWVVGGLCLAAITAQHAVAWLPTTASTVTLLVIAYDLTGHVQHIRWRESHVAGPAFCIAVGIPLFSSISMGVGVGLTLHAAWCHLKGQPRPWSQWALGLITLLV